MHRFLGPATIGLLAALALSAAADAAQAAPQAYVDQENRFQLTLPEGWKIEPDYAKDNIKLAVFSADDIVQCNVSINRPGQIASVPQATLDMSFRRGDADGVVTREVARLGLEPLDLQQALIERDGHPAVYASLGLSQDSGKVRLRKLFMASTGRSYNFNCTILAPEEGAHAADLDAYYASIHLIYP